MKVLCEGTDDQGNPCQLAAPYVVWHTPPEKLMEAGLGHQLDDYSGVYCKTHFVQLVVEDVKQCTLGLVLSVSYQEFMIHTVAKARGLVTYDTALPQDWVDETYKRTGLYAPGHIVWSYDGAGFAGQPVALDEDGKLLLNLLQE